MGDSFSPSGLDDYCAQNRVFLHERRWTKMMVEVGPAPVLPTGP